MNAMFPFSAHERILYSIMCFLSIRNAEDGGSFISASRMTPVFISLHSLFVNHIARGRSSGTEN